MKNSEKISFEHFNGNNLSFMES